MEEEIIISEEETFNYHSLRYILDKNGYVCHASIGGLVICDLGECTEYKGEIPDGYETIEEWYDGEIEKLNAWKIIDGNLVFDENKYNELQVKFELETEENATATHKWVRNQLGKNETLINDELSNNATGTSLVILEGSGNYEIPNINLSSETVEECNVISSNKNLIGIDTVSQTIDGLDITINVDGTIKLNGTATEDIEFVLKGTSTSTDMLFLIQKDIDYVVGGLVDNIYLNLYEYDGVDRSLLGSFTNTSFNLSDSSIVTQSTLSIVTGTTFEDVIISPQLELGNTPTDFIKHEENKTKVSFYEQNASVYEKLNSYEPTTIIMTDKEVEISVDYFIYKYLDKRFSNIEADANSIKITVSQNSEQILETTDAINGFESDVKNIQNSIDTVAGEVSTLSGKITDMSYTFGTKGLSIGTSIDTNNSLLDNTGIKVYNYEKLNAIFNNKGSGIDKLIVTGTAQLGYLRFVKGTKNNKPVTKIFHLKSLIEDLEDLM